MPACAGVSAIAKIGARSWFVAAALGGLVALSSACAGETERRFDKVILISIDTLRADYLGTYGAPAGLTPEIDAFGETATVFDDAITQATSTLPSHSSLFYSVYTFVHRAYIGNPPNPQLTSPVEVLRQSAFRTAAFVGGGQLRPRFGLNRGFETYEIVNTRNISERRGTVNRDRLADLLAAADGFLQEHGDEPFFLFLHTYEPHSPYNAPPRFIEQVRGLRMGASTVALDAPLVEFEIGLGVPEDAWVTDEHRLLYASEVSYVDDFIGRLLDSVARLGLDDEVVIAFLADHGESLGERGLLGHNRFTTEQLRVPLIIRLPGVRPQRLSTPVQLIDVMPTLYGLVEHEPPYPFMGEDLTSLLLGVGPGPSSDRVRFSENKGTGAVLQGPWKAVFKIKNHSSFQLFNLEDDPGELRDRAGDHPELGRQLIKEYQRLVVQNAELPSLFPRMGAPALDRETLRELRTLGYVR